MQYVVWKKERAETKKLSSLSASTSLPPRRNICWKTGWNRWNGLRRQNTSPFFENEKSTIRAITVNGRVDNSLTKSDYLEELYLNPDTLNTEQVVEDEEVSCSEFISNETLKKPDKTILRKRDRHFNYREKKMIIICVCNVRAFLITWLPLVGYGFSEMIGRTIPDVWFVRLGFCLALINSIFNPLFISWYDGIFVHCFEISLQKH